MRGSGRDKEESRDKSQRRLFLMKREEREVLILARRGGLPQGENVAAECEDADRLDRGPRTGTGTDTERTLTLMFISQHGHTVVNMPEDKSFPHFKGNDHGTAFFIFVNRSAVTQIRATFIVKK